MAFLVGTVLNLINQGDQLVNSGSINLAKCLLTYLVPYCVATYGAVSALAQVR
ncbi:nitrate/nitrite transporter NrtS [Aquicoccus sp. G2-2]|uniref:nitrate/nitrite transporter NrtS n=1 Tax=Aquicoccus sp. G2-2 TaxID=3092120 RepID=UPI00366A8D84